tara:strand:- start:348 stop:776 length:429 start_codon:yes stop_codon:yes gene_type:complete
MVRLLLLFLSFPVFADLDLTLPQEFDFEQIEKDRKLIKDWEDRSRVKFWDNKPYPSEEQIRYSWRIHALDMMTTVYALENRDNIKEANWILGEQPEIHEVIALKLLVLPFVHQNSNEHMMVYFNAVTTATVVNNLYVINKYD